MGGLEAVLEAGVRADGPIVFLTGAGVSAESGIPTFRGPEGHWQIGSRNYHPEELATAAAFAHLPRAIWGWYLYRRAACLAARPNVAHEALARAETSLADRFLLVTQNVDGLHRRAGSSAARTYEVHGRLDVYRCARGCCEGLTPIPAALDAWPRGRAIGDAEEALLACPRCGGPGRPHVLWFDEYYDENIYRYDSSIRAARAAAMLVVVGTSGATSLPVRMAEIVTARGGRLVVLNPEESPFSGLARRLPAGVFVRGAAGTLVPAAVDLICRSA